MTEKKSLFPPTSIVYTTEDILKLQAARLAAADALAADAEKLLRHRRNGEPHPVDYQRLEQSLGQYREAGR